MADADAEDEETTHEDLVRRHKAEVRELDGRHRREAKKTMSKDAKATFVAKCAAEVDELRVKQMLEIAAATAGPEEVQRLKEEEDRTRIAAAEAAEAAAADAARAQALRDDEAAANEGNRTRKLRVVADLYRIPKSVRAIFHTAAEFAANKATAATAANGSAGTNANVSINVAIRESECISGDSSSSSGGGGGNGVIFSFADAARAGVPTGATASSVKAGRKDVVGGGECTIGSMDLHRPMSKSQLKALLQQYYTLYGLDGDGVSASANTTTSATTAAAAKECISVTVHPGDNLYKIAREASVAAEAQAAEKALNAAAARERLAIGNTSTTPSDASNSSSGSGKAKATAKDDKGPVEDEGFLYFPPASDSEAFEDDYYDDLQQANKNANAATGGTVVAGVWMPSVSQTLSTASSSNINLNTNTKRALGGSSIGGWGVDADKTWKPTELPSRSVSFTTDSGANKTKSAGTGQGKSSGAGGLKKPQTGTGAAGAAPTAAATAAQDQGRPPSAAALAKAALPTGPVSVSKDALLRCFLTKLTLAHTVTLPNGTEKIATGAPPTVDISVNVVRGNKSATAIRGLEELIGEEEMGTLRERLARKFAASCSVGPCEHNPKILEIMVQGNLARETREWLVETYGMPNSCITSSVGKGVKKKKAN